MPVITSTNPGSIPNRSAANRYAPPRASVRDVADPYAAAEPADRVTRLAAAILDSIIVSAMVYLPLLVAVFIGGAAAGASGNSNAIGPTVLIGFALALAGFVAWCWLTIKYVIADGQSIAKKILSIKVVRSDGTPIGLGRIFWLRNVVNGVLAIIPLYGLIDVLFIFSESRQCVHDKLADTMVVKA